MPEPKHRKSIIFLLLGAMVLLVAGIALLWRESQQEILLYEGSYEPLGVGSEFYFGPGIAEVFGWLLSVLGIGVLGAAGGLLLSQLAHLRKIILFGGLVLAVAGLGLLIWDYNQVRTFGWFAYEPLSKADVFPASAAQDSGKVALLAGALLTGTHFGLRPGSKSAGQTSTS